MRNVIKHIFLTRRFFLAAAILVALFTVSFLVPFLYPVSQALLVLEIIAAVLDGVFIFHPNNRLACSRDLPELLSLGWDTPVKLYLTNYAGTPLRLEVIDELPLQLQIRDHTVHQQIEPETSRVIEYEIRPVTRGDYNFGQTHVYAKSMLGLVEKRHSFDNNQDVVVYPSIKEMKEYEIKTISRIARFHGIKKLRRVGHHYEFEQIKPYVPGDDYRSINWKATGRKHELMLNQYQDERSQQIYMALDCSRYMKMPFSGMTLLDYSINSALAISNIAMKRYDKTGLLSFAERPLNFIKAGNQQVHLQKILNGLYHLAVGNREAHFEHFYQFLRKNVQGRSLVLLFTNFESQYSLDRVLPVLRKINQAHLLITVIFKNAEIEEYANTEAANMEEIYARTIAGSFVNEKKQMVHELGKRGIQAIYTSPQDLTLNTVNKYLELKSRGMI